MPIKSKLYTNTNTKHVNDAFDYTSPIQNGDSTLYAKVTLDDAITNLYNNLASNLTMGLAAKQFTVEGTSNSYIADTANTFADYTPIGGLKNLDGAVIDIYNMSPEKVLYYLLKL